MKRIFAISTMLVLLCSAFSPVWAADMDTMPMPACHRAPMQKVSATHTGKHAKVHHCDGMDMSSPESSSGDSIAANHSHSCPMNCCVQGAPASGVASSAIPVLPPLATSEAEFDLVSVVFANAGFSSHTDRGPPVA